MRNSNHQKENGGGKIRYAVVGLGHIAQNAILPAFAHAQKNSALTALVSDDPAKLRVLSRQYGVKNVFDYEDYDKCLASGGIDAVYIALPNSMHEDFCIRAARAGIHVLCEKPLAGTKKECKHIVKACRKFGVKLMTAYRLHFEHANLEAAEMIHSGKIGEPRIFNSTFSQQVRPGNMRVKPRNEGGPLHDIGIYCINAARYLFRAEPTQGVSFSASGKDPRFRKVDEMNSIILRFPEERLASFTVSFGATDTANYEVIGTKGKLRAVHGYEYSTPITLELTADGRTHTKKYPLRDQFAPELIYFSDCIQKGREPEPSGEEGLRDVRIIQSLHKSAKRGVPVRLQPLKDHHYPDLKQDIYRPKVDKRRLVHVSSPST